jgi:hypothetical protein
MGRGLILPLYRQKCTRIQRIVPSKLRACRVKSTFSVIPEIVRGPRGILDEPMTTSPGGVPITTRRIAMHKSIRMSTGSIGLSAFALSEYMIIPQQHFSAVTPNRSTERLMTFSGPFEREGQVMDLALHRHLSREEIARALARINLLNEFFSDVGRRFEAGVETLIPLFDGLQAGFRKIDFKTTGTVFIFEQDSARCELVSASVEQMTDLRDGFGHILNL